MPAGLRFKALQMQQQAPAAQAPGPNNPYIMNTNGQVTNQRPPPTNILGGTGSLPGQGTAPAPALPAASGPPMTQEQKMQAYGSFLQRGTKMKRRMSGG